MRLALAPLRGKRVPVVARFAGVSRKGHVILKDVRTVSGQCQYVWIPFEDWKGPLQFPGAEVRFQATVREYYSDGRNEFDFGLTAIEIEARS